MYVCVSDIINRSLCKNCTYRVQRIISSEGLELYDDENDEVGELEGKELIHEACSILHMELDHIVLKCSAYIPIITVDDLFLTDYFKT